MSLEMGFLHCSVVSTAKYILMVNEETEDIRKQDLRLSTEGLR